MKLETPSRLFFLTVIISMITGLLGSGILEISFASGTGNIITVKPPIIYKEEMVSKLLPLEATNKPEIEKAFDKYLEDKKDNSDRWLTFMSILSTIFAIFFVYSGFKIDDTVKKVNEAKEQMRDIHEYTIQLEYCMSFIIQKQYDKAIDALEVLRKEPFVWKDQDKRNTCNFFLAHCYYERGIFKKNRDDLAMAVQYIDDAIPNNAIHPFKLEIIAKFNEFDTSKKVSNS